MGAGGVARGEQVVVVFLEAGSPQAVQRITDSLRDREFDVYPATAQGNGPAAEFDYERARFLVVALSGEPATLAPGNPAATPASTGEAAVVAGIKVLLFPGTPAPEGNPDMFYLDWDPGDAWLDRLLEAVRALNPD